MTADWTLRPATPDDHKTMIAVVDDWWGKPMVALLPRLFLDHFHTSSLVAETEDGEMVGLLVGFFSQADPTAAYVHFVAVDPERRGDGLARSRTTTTPATSPSSSTAPSDSQIHRPGPVRNSSVHRL
jgi:hypothetical protein